MTTSLLIILAVSTLGCVCIHGLRDGLKTVSCASVAAGLIALIAVLALSI
jgi:hypothetical protein